MSTRILASLGASHRQGRGTGAQGRLARTDRRGGHPARYPDGVPGERPFDRCCQFNTQNHDKRNLVVDVKTEAGLEIVRRLADRGRYHDRELQRRHARPDGPRLGFSACAQRTADRCRDAGFMAATARSRTDVALGPSMEMMAGMARIIGHGDGRPVTDRAGLSRSDGRLQQRRRGADRPRGAPAHGQGQYLELAQREAPPRAGSARRSCLPVRQASTASRRATVSTTWFRTKRLRCAGDDAWVAIAAADDAEFAALARTAGQPQLRCRPALRHDRSTAPQRG